LEGKVQGWAEWDCCTPGIGIEIAIWDNFYQPPKDRPSDLGQKKIGSNSEYLSET